MVGEGRERLNFFRKTIFRMARSWAKIPFLDWSNIEESLPLSGLTFLSHTAKLSPTHTATSSKLWKTCSKSGSCLILLTVMKVRVLGAGMVSLLSCGISGTSFLPFPIISRFPLLILGRSSSYSMMRYLKIWSPVQKPMLLPSNTSYLNFLANYNL